MCPRAGLDRCGKSRPIEIRSPDRPTRSESKKSKKKTELELGKRMLLCAEKLQRVAEQNVFPNILLSSSTWKMETQVHPKHENLSIK